MPNLNHINATGPGGFAAELGRIKSAVATFGVSRAWLYRAAADNPNLLRKLGRSTLVDFAVLRGILAALPPAKLRQPAEETAA